MHGRRLIALILSGAATGTLYAQAPGQEILTPPTPPVALVAAEGEEAEAEGNFIRQGKPVPDGESMTMNLNTIEQYSIAPYQLWATPRSTNENIAELRLVPAPQGQLPNAFVLTSKELVGTTELVLPLVKPGEKPFERRIELLVIDQISQAYKGYLEKVIKEMFPTSVLDILVANSSTAVLKGYVERAEHVAPIENLVRGFLAARVGAAPDSMTVVNALRVVGAQQVQLKVVIAEVQRSKVRDLGVDWNWFNSAGGPNAWIQGASASLGNFGNRGSAIAIGGGTPLSLASLAGTGTGSSNINFVLNRNGTVAMQGFIRAMVTSNLAKILAEPVLTTLSGQPAYFNSGGQVPVLTPQGNGTIGISYRDFGTNLRFVPTVLGDGRVRVEVRPEVSDLNFGNGVIVNGIQVPGFDTRVAESTVEMEAGQTMVIAGLIQKRLRAGGQKLPFLGDIPVASVMFNNKTMTQVDTELMIMITPHLVEAMDQAPCELPGRESRVPNDFEYYIGSKFEPPCFNAAEKQHGKGKHHIVSPAPRAVKPYDNYGLPAGTPYMPLAGDVNGLPPEGAMTPIELSPGTETPTPTPAPVEEPATSMVVPPSLQGFDMSYERAGESAPDDGGVELAPSSPPELPPQTDTAITRTSVLKPKSTTSRRGTWIRAVK